MLDAPLRRVLATPLDRIAGAIDRGPVTPDRLTGLGLLLGLASAGTAAAQLWAWSLILWLVSRLLDGLDGALARRRARSTPAGARGSSAGGFLDVTADVVVYGTTVVGVGIGVTTAGYAGWLPFVAVLATYYVNGAAFLAYSSIAERSGHRIDDGRSLSFFGTIAEGTETIVVHALWLILPAYAEPIAWVWAGVVAISAAQRIVVGYRRLGRRC